MRRKILVVIFVAICLTSANEFYEKHVLEREKRYLLFPQFTTLQLSMCLIAQISSLPSHKVAVNHGFQINYNLPFNLSSWESPIFWARSVSKVSNPLVDFFERLAASSDDNSTVNASEEKEERIKRDLSAGQFYSGLIETLDFAGYEEECLLKSVCELAKHPLDLSEEENLIEEMLHLILTPSAHQAFDTENEFEEKNLYEKAETNGKLGLDCDLIYNSCRVSPLHKISNFIDNAV